MLSKVKKKNTGNRKHRVEVQKQQKTPDGMGGDTVEWVKDFDMWCNIKPVSGNQRLRLDAIQSTVDHVIEVRHGLDLSNDKRIKYGTRYLNIHYVLNEGEEGAYDELAATELKNES